jgi:hypothetical protein
MRLFKVAIHARSSRMAHACMAQSCSGMQNLQLADMAGVAPDVLKQLRAILHGADELQARMLAVCMLNRSMLALSSREHAAIVFSTRCRRPLQHPGSGCALVLSRASQASAKGAAFSNRCQLLCLMRLQ